MEIFTSTETPCTRSSTKDRLFSAYNQVMANMAAMKKIIRETSDGETINLAKPYPMKPEGTTSKTEWVHSYKWTGQSDEIELYTSYRQDERSHDGTRYLYLHLFDNLTDAINLAMALAITLDSKP